MANIDSAYLVYKDGSKIYAKNGITGEIDFEESDAKNIITGALGKLANGREWKEKITIMGDLLIDNSTSPLIIPDYTTFKLYGRLTAKDKTKILVKLGSHTTIENGLYDGNRGTSFSIGLDDSRVIFTDNETDVIIKDLRIINGYGRGIQVRYARDVMIENVIVENCDKNIMHNVKAQDLETDQGMCFMKNITSLNAKEFGFYGTSPNLFLDGYYSRGCPLPMSIEGFNNISLENINTDKPIQISTSDIRKEMLGKIGYRIILNKVFVPGIYMRFKTPLESITLDNIHITGSPTNGLQIVASSGNDVKYLTMNNLEVSNAKYNGVSISRDARSTGKFKYILMNNCIVHDCGARGMVLSDIDHIHINNSFIKGNYSTGIDISNCNRVKLIGSDSLVYGVNNQKCPLLISDSNYINVIGCYLENGGEPATITNVGSYNFESCEGSFPILRKIGTALMPIGKSSIMFAHGMAGTPKVTLGATHSELADATVISDDTNIEIKVSRSVTADRKINWFASIKV